MSLITTPDSELSACDLKTKYEALDPGDHWAQHLEHRIWDWKQEVASESVLLGYWEWVKYMIEEQDL